MGLYTGSVDYWKFWAEHLTLRNPLIYGPCCIQRHGEQNKQLNNKNKATQFYCLDINFGQFNPPFTKKQNTHSKTTTIFEIFKTAQFRTT